jgi:pilus assembly protein FimV
VVAHRPIAPAKAPERSIFDTLADYWWAAALVVVALLGLMGLRAWRARRESGFDDSLGRLAAASADSLMRDREPSIETTPQIAPLRENNFLVEESGSHERPAFTSAPSPAPARHVSSDETISSETAINLDQGDPLAEADFHMAYGLYDQAADLVRIAIARDPERRDLKLKLLEVFFVWGNKEQFLQTARELAETRAQAVAGEWEKIVIMGKQLAPEDPLFTGGAAVSGAAAAGVDLDLEGGQSRVDFDVLGEQVGSSSPADVDLDIGTAIGERDPTAEAAASQATDKNLALHEEDTVNRVAATGTTRQMTAQLDRGALLDESSPEAPTVEQPALQSQQPALRQKVEMALKQGGAAEHTTELAIDDLGLDLGSLDTMDQPALPSSSDAPTLVAGLDERSRRLIETAAHAQHPGNGAAEPKVSETGSWNFDADALGEAATAVLPRENGPGGDVSATSRLAALKPDALDFDIGESSEDAPVAHQNGSGIDLDVGTATVPDAAFTATQRLGNEELALPDLEPVTMSEVGTKLDLARAYMDMGDPEGARNILEEVMHEGSTAQKQEAQRLIESLPG